MWAGRSVVACQRHGIPAVLLQHELGQILQDLLAVQSHKLLPADLTRGATVSRGLTAASPPSPQLLSQDSSEVRGREGSGQEREGGAVRQGWRESAWERWEAEADPH